MTIAPDQDNTYQFFQPLSPEERAALKSDIKVRGILVPIELDSTGVILDGHHRWEIAQELGWTVEQIPTVVRAELTTEAEKIAHVLKMNLLRRKSISPLTQAKCILTLKEARGIDTSKNHNRYTGRGDRLSSLWEELGLNPRSGQRYLRYYEELKDHADLCQQVESGAKTIAQARKEAGTLTPKPPKKTSLFAGKGAMGFLDEVKEFAYKQLEHYEESGVLAHSFDSDNDKIILVLTIKV